MITNLLPAEATHTTLDLFEKQPVLITFDNAFTQKVGPSYSPDGPMLEFEVLGDRNNFIDLQKLLLGIKCKISRYNDGDLRTGTDAPYFYKYRRAIILQIQTRHTLATTHYILSFQNALYLLTVLKFPTKTEKTRTKHSLKQIFLQEKQQKTHG